MDSASFDLVQEWLIAGRSRGAGWAREVAGSVRGGATGVPEFRNMSGRWPVLSTPIFMVFEGPKTDFWSASKKCPFIALFDLFHMLRSVNLHLILLLNIVFKMISLTSNVSTLDTQV